MGTISRVEDMLVWQESRVLVKDIFVLTSSKNFEKEYALRDQMKRSAISIMSNIAEGFGRGGNKEFIQFLYISNGSVNELKSQLYISFDFNLVSEDVLNEFLSVLLKVENMNKALIRKMKESEFTGFKYKTETSLNNKQQTTNNQTKLK